MFGELVIVQLLVTTSTISFLSNHFVISEVFCGNGFLYSHAYTYQRTFNEHPIPAQAKNCLIRIFDGINTLIKYIDI